jgi:ABC-type sugar transport system substrate-binding protein
MTRTVDPTALRVALFHHNDNDYQQALRDDCLAAAKRLGVSVRFFSAADNSAKQVDQIQACLRERPDQRPTIFLVAPVREAALLSTAYAAARLGVGWVLLGRWSGYMADLREEFPRLPIFSVAADQREIGRIQGRQFRALLPDGGELVYIRGPLGTSSAIRRFEGVQEVLQGSAIKVYALSSDWTKEGGAQAMTDWLRVFRWRDFPRFVVGGQNDTMTMGSRGALIEAARERAEIVRNRVLFTGCDGTPRYGQRLVLEGSLRATVIMPPTAAAALDEVAAMLLDGRPRPRAEIVLTPSSFPDLRDLEGDPSARPSAGLRAAAGPAR